MTLTAGEEATLALWLRLTLTPGIGPVGARALLDAIGPPDAIFRAPLGELAATVGERPAAALRADDRERERRIDAALAWGAIDGHHLITDADPRYPALLREIADAPVLLHVRGRPEALSRPSLAIVGSRNPTAAGLSNARAFGHCLSEAGWTIVSGLALGIDGAAHDGSLAGGAGTVAVLGTGADVVYPARHADLAERVAADGAVVSELPLGTGPAPGLFPRRNRLIAGLSRGVIVVEAALRSGSLITARHAGDFGREVFAIPGSIHSPLARGCHALIRQGAALVESAQDVLSELRAPSPAGAPRPGGPATARSPEAPGERHADAAAPPERERSDPILDAIGHDPVLPDTLSAELGLAAGEIAARLVVLELAGCVLRLPDGRVSRPPPVGRLASGSERLL